MVASLPLTLLVLPPKMLSLIPAALQSYQLNGLALKYIYIYLGHLLLLNFDLKKQPRAVKILRPLLMAKPCSIYRTMQCCPRFNPQ